MQNCKIYLSGTKYDLVDNDKKNRQVDYHETTDYAAGEYWKGKKATLFEIQTPPVEDLPQAFYRRRVVFMD